MNLSEFSEAIEKIFKFEIVRQNNHYQYYKYNNLEFRLKKKQFRETYEKLETLISSEGYEIYESKFYEVSVVQSNKFFIARNETIAKKDNINGIDYNLGSPSDEYLLFFVKNLFILAQTEDISRPMFLHRLNNKNVGDTHELFEILKEIIPRFKTLQISTLAANSLKDFENKCSSFLFTIGYNTDISFLPNNITEEFTRALRIGRIRRSNMEDIEAPKRVYIQDLILFYQKGISSESVDLQFLSFYHILENFFEKIYNEDLIQTIQSTLTSPSFSYKRGKDLNSLVQIIQDKLRYKNEEFQINEPEALRLVLDNFINDFNEIKTEISIYDPQLLLHYKSSEVSFSKGNKVNFDEDREVILKNLRERIYKTRNSIVHSKETDKSKYLPFKHDKELSKEIILMRIIAEKIVIGSSNEL